MTHYRQKMPHLHAEKCKQSRLTLRIWAGGVVYMH